MNKQHTLQASEINLSLLEVMEKKRLQVEQCTALCYQEYLTYLCYLSPHREGLETLCQKG